MALYNCLLIDLKVLGIQLYTLQILIFAPFLVIFTFSGLFLCLFVLLSFLYFQRNAINGEILAICHH